MITTRLLWNARASLLVVLAAMLLTASVATAQQTYKTPQAAVDALIAAAKADDEKAALAVFGKDGEDIISSGDKVSDEAIRKRFVES